MFSKLLDRLIDCISFLVLSLHGKSFQSTVQQRHHPTFQEDFTQEAWFFDRNYNKIIFKDYIRDKDFYQDYFYNAL